MTDTLCKTVGSISSFSKIEKGITISDRILKDRTVANNVQNTIHISDKQTSSFTFSNFFLPVVRKLTPLPELNWADSTELWNFMLEKDKKYARDALYLRTHKHLQPRMRSILLDWLIEVSQYNSDKIVASKTIQKKLCLWNLNVVVLLWLCILYFSVGICKLSVHK
jgi:hypothetical protein